MTNVLGDAITGSQFSRLRRAGELKDLHGCTSSESLRTGAGKKSDNLRKRPKEPATPGSGALDIRPAVSGRISVNRRRDWSRLTRATSPGLDSCQPWQL